jgi:hypothetical protein
VWVRICVRLLSTQQLGQAGNAGSDVPRLTTREALARPPLQHARPLFDGQSDPRPTHDGFRKYLLRLC